MKRLLGLPLGLCLAAAPTQFATFEPIEYWVPVNVAPNALVVAATVRLPSAAASRLPLPEIARFVPRLGDPSFRVRYAAHRELAARLKETIAGNPMLAAETRAAVRKAVAGAVDETTSEEVRRRLGQAVAEMDAEAARYVCRCRARCRDGRLSGEATAPLIDGRCAIDGDAYERVCRQCRDPEGGDHRATRPETAACVLERLEDPVSP